MPRILVYFAHPGQRHSKINSRMAGVAAELAAVSADVSYVDLYAEYPRFNIDVDIEQQRLLDHDVIVLQFPVYWYSTPSLLKEWQDLVLEYGFAYGPEGDKLAGKLLLLAVTTGGSEDSYQNHGVNRLPLADFFSPLKQTAQFCQMHFLPPYVLYAAHEARADGCGDSHVESYRSLLLALQSEHFDVDRASSLSVLRCNNLPIAEGR